MKRVRFFSFLILAILFRSEAGFAWGNIGHESVAEVAERYLSDDARKLVLSILGVEPLAAAAIFPDEVRSDARFKGFAPYHFVEIRNGTTYVQVEPKDGHTIISKVPALLMSPTVSRDRKMIFLRYLIHVVGDVHQPLHVGNGIDMGANLCNVNWVEPETYGTNQPRKTFLNLHTVWDENIIDSMKHQYGVEQEAKHPSQKNNPQKRWFGYKELTDWLMVEWTGALGPKAKDRKPGKFTTAELDAFAAATVLQWYRESRGMHSEVYPETTFNPDPYKRKYCKVKNPATNKIEDNIYDFASVPTLDEAYANAKAPIIRKQILKGGLRLAALLNRLAAGQAIPVEDELKILQSVLIEHEPAR